MTKIPDITVIIPMYNSEKYIANTLSSVFEQEEHKFTFEILVVDDCSTDESREIVRNILNDEITLIELKQNGGTANARNVGLRLAKGMWIQFLDSDDSLGLNVFRQFELNMQSGINIYVFSIISEFNDHDIVQTITKVHDNRALGHFGSACNKFYRKDLCVEFKTDFSFEDVCFIVDMMNNPSLKSALIPDAYYLYNRKNAESKMANFNKIEYSKMYNYIYGQIDKSDQLTKIFILEAFVGILFSKGMPFFLSLLIAIRTFLKLYMYLPKVLFNGIRNNVKIQKVIHVPK